MPYHITQRGNRRERVFFDDLDRQAYLDDLRYYSARHSLEVLAYCLMDNHVHLVAVPGTVAALHRALKPVHLLHAQRINLGKNWCGHLWQGRFFSSALDERHLWTAIRYVELNPVRAGMTGCAERYRWSSAAAHCGLRSDALLSHDPEWCRLLNEISNWSDWLAEAVDTASQASLRDNTQKGLPSGSKEFIRSIEQRTGRILTRRPRGRPAKSGAHCDGRNAELESVSLFEGG
ncbi:MAG: transposase [Steroidobacteraceae bacterium]